MRNKKKRKNRRKKRIHSFIFSSTRRRRCARPLALRGGGPRVFLGRPCPARLSSPPRASGGLLPRLVSDLPRPPVCRRSGSGGDHLRPVSKPVSPPVESTTGGSLVCPLAVDDDGIISGGIDRPLRRAAIPARRPGGGQEHVEVLSTDLPIAVSSSQTARPLKSRQPQTHRPLKSRQPSGLVDQSNVSQISSPRSL